MKKLSLIFIMLIVTVFISCQESAYKEKIVSFENATAPAHKEFYEHYGNIYLFYKENPQKYPKYSERNNTIIEEYSAIEELKYYYKSNNKLCYVGKINLDGVFDKNDKCIWPFPEIPKEAKAVGYDSRILESPFNRAVILVENGSALSTDPYGYIRMNYETNTFETFNPFNDEE